MDTSLDLMQFRSRLSDSPDAPDPAACADLCLAFGLTTPARMLYETAFVRQGFSRQALAHQAGTATRTGLWAPAAPPPADARRTGAGTIEIAVAELEEFARALAGRRSGAAESIPEAHASAGDPSLRDLAGMVEQLYTFMREPEPAAGWGAAEALMRRFREAGRQGARLDHRQFGAAPLPLLAAAISFVGLREFFLANHELMFGDTGSAEILHRVARFDSVGLGPYFVNVARLAGRSRDVFELARTAARAGGSWREDDVQQWVVILSQHLVGALRQEVVDDLGDLGATAALTAFYDRAARQPGHRVDVGLVMRLRDAALDNGDLALARRAQSLVAQLHPDQPLERAILGTIEGTAGLIAAAEQSFLTCLRIAPEFQDVPERLLALRAGDFDRYLVRAGFGTPHDRRITRQRRREQARPDFRPVRRRALAVEL